MARRVGIELGPSHCRLVEIASGGGFGRRGRSTAARVRTFASIPYGTLSPVGLVAALRPLLSRGKVSKRAAVAAWGLRGSHQYLFLPPADPADLVELGRREARRVSPGSMPEAEITDGVLVGSLRDVAGVGGQREVTYVVAAAEDVRSRIRPLADVGFQIEAVVTPAVALGTVARLRPALVPDAVTAVVASEADVTCLSIVRNGSVLVGRELGWGFASDGQLDREQFAAKLAAELRRSLTYVKQNFRVDVRQIVVCGGLPDPRSLTAPLMEALGIDVEVLDSLEGIHAGALPEAADEFRTKIAELRMAWALAGEEPALNLLPRETRSRQETRRETYRVGAGIAAGLLIAAAGLLAATLLARGAERGVQRLRQEIADLEPQIRDIEARRRAQLLAGGRRAALDAFATQGPRLARVLEELSRAKQNVSASDVVLLTLQLQPKEASWQLVLTGESVADDPAQAQIGFNEFLRTVQTSAVIGSPVRPPVMKINSGEPGVDQPQSGEPGAARAAAGTGDPHEVAAGPGPGDRVGGAQYAPGTAPGELRDPAYEAYLAGLRAYEDELFRRRRPFEEHWNLHPVKPLEYYRWLEEEQEYAARAAERTVVAPGAPGRPAPPPKPAAVLQFSVEFEVRK